MKEKLLSDKTRYLLGLSGQNILYALISSCFAYFLQFTVLVPAFWLGLIISTAKIFDAFKDPFIGLYISKSNRSLAEYLSILPIPTAILTVLCFTQKIYSPENNHFENTLIILYSFIVFIFWEIVFSFGDIPMVSYPNVICKNEEERKKLFALRSIGAMVCSICCLIVQPLVFGLSSLLGNTPVDERNAFFIVAFIFSFSGCVLYKFTVPKGSLKSVLKHKEEENNRLYKYIFTNSLLRKIIISGILFSLNSLPGVLLPPLVTYYFSSKNSFLTFLYTLFLGIGSFFGMLLSAVFVPVISKRIGNIKAYVLFNLSNILPNILIFILYLRNKDSVNSTQNFAVMVLLLIISGCCVSFSSNIRTLLIDDAVEIEYQKSKVKPTALFFSFVTAIIKINSGISSLVSSLGYTVIDFTSYETAKLNEYIANGFVPRENAEYTPLFTMMFFMFTVLPAASSFLSVLPFIYKKNNC